MLSRQFAGIFEGDDADGPAGGEINKGGGHFAPVAKLECALAQAAARDQSDGVGGAAVDFDVGNETLAIGSLRTALEAQAAKPEQRHAHTENLPAHRCPCAASAWRRSSSRDSISLLLRRSADALTCPPRRTDLLLCRRCAGGSSSSPESSTSTAEPGTMS